MMAAPAALPSSSLSSTDIKSASIVTAEEAEVQEVARLLTGLGVPITFLKWI